MIDGLNAAVNESLKSSELKASLSMLGFEPKIMSPQEFAEFLTGEVSKWPAIIKASGVKPE